MVTYNYQHRVRYRECDPMGVVYHAHYIDYFEAARTEALRDMGIVYKKLEDDGVQMPTIDLAVKYRQPARYDDLLEIKVILKDKPGVRIRIDYEVRRVNEETLLTTGHVTLCFMDIERKRPVMAPAVFAEMYDTYAR
ncbi:MAG: thioesterase family protein [Bacteroidota bacterium]